MDETRPSNRSKRQKPPEEGFWECSVCTFRNSPEAYKCDMCDIRKGTSTRKPRLNSQLVAQQAAQQFVPTPPPTKRERNSIGPELNSDFEFSDNSNQGNISHLFEEPLSNNNSLDLALNSPEETEVVPECIKPEIKQEKLEKEKPEKPEKEKLEKPEKEKPEKHKTEKHVKTEKKPKKVRVPKVKKNDKIERCEEKMSVTVNNVTVIITDYIPKTVKKERRTSTEVNNHIDNSDNSSVSGGSNCAGEELLTENHHHHHLHH